LLPGLIDPQNNTLFVPSPTWYRAIIPICSINLLHYTAFFPYNSVTSHIKHQLFFSAALTSYSIKQLLPFAALTPHSKEQPFPYVALPSQNKGQLFPFAAFTFHQKTSISSLCSINLAVLKGDSVWRFFRDVGNDFLLREIPFGTRRR